MGQLGIFIGLLFSLAIAIFALANSQPVLINYLFGKTEVSAVIVILCSAVSGALAIFLFDLVRQVKASFHLRGLRGEMRIMEERIRDLEKERDILQGQAEINQQTFTGEEVSPEILGQGPPTGQNDDIGARKRKGLI